MRRLSTFLLILCGMYAYSQQVNSTNLDSAALFPATFGTFKNFRFILNGGTITRDELADYPEAKLSKVLPYEGREKRKYQGTVYFYTPWYPPPPPRRYADDPAYFINGIQVSPYTIRSSRAEEYIRIERSAQDTVIDGKRYGGTVHVYTDEDFFTERVPLHELIDRYIGLPPERVIVHWRGRSINELNTGEIIHDHFPLYYINPKGLQAVEVDCLRFAEGERYVVHLVDNGYRFNYLTEKGWRAPRRTWMIFDDPFAIDPSGPCYLADFDTTGKVIHHRTEAEPKPFTGSAAYLEKLSALMELPADKPSVKTIPDSITVQFIVLGNGKLTGLESIGPDKPGHKRILNAIKQHSCVWSVATDRRHYLLFKRKMITFYSRDQSGDIQSLDALEYQYDGVH